MSFDSGMFGGGLGSLLGGLFGNSDKPYGDYKGYIDQAEGEQRPYQTAGTNALNDYQNWLNGQKDPAKFINDQMKNYNESDYAHNLQNASMRAGQNAASASGLMGSTPMMQQLQQNAGQITSADQNQWLQHVLGINTQYGQGQHNLVQGGQHAADQLTGIHEKQGEAAYGQAAGKQRDFWNTIGGGIGILGSFL